MRENKGKFFGDFKKVICILVTTFNRINVTRMFLKRLSSELELSGFEADIYIVDDGSTDGTAEMIMKDYPQVNLIRGTGQLYWAGSVHLAIESLGKRLTRYSAILHLNDDVELNCGSLNSLFSIFQKERAIIGGAVLTRIGEIESTGSVLGKICKPRVRKLSPTGEVQHCDALPGQILLIPTEIFFKLGGFDKNLKYSLIDLEFTIRASRSGFPVLLAPKPLGTTEIQHNYYLESSSKRGTLKDLIGQIPMHPKGPHYKDSIYYLRKVSPVLWWIWIIPYYRGFFVAILMSWVSMIGKQTTK